MKMVMVAAENPGVEYYKRLKQEAARIKDIMKDLEGFSTVKNITNSKDLAFSFKFCGGSFEVVMEVTKTPGHYLYEVKCVDGFPDELVPVMRKYLKRILKAAIG